MSNIPAVGEKVSVGFRYDGNGSRVKTAYVEHRIAAVYEGADINGNYNVKLDNGDVFTVMRTDRGLKAIK